MVSPNKCFLNWYITTAVTLFVLLFLEIAMAASFATVSRQERLKLYSKRSESHRISATQYGISLISVGSNYLIPYTILQNIAP